MRIPDGTTTPHSPCAVSPRPWSRWRGHFERQHARPLPPIAAPPELPPSSADALARSLARFQIGETGEGRVVAEIARADLRGIDDDYRRALALFVDEEGRHAAILAAAVRTLGGELLATTWSERLFVGIRGLAGLRFKLLTMLAAEVVGAAFYGGLAEGLPSGDLRAAVEQIANDERAHLRFHRCFFHIQAPTRWRRALFLFAWYPLASGAALVALADHYPALRALGIPVGSMAVRLLTLIRDGAL